jgi:hypothetical protein
VVVGLLWLQDGVKLQLYRGELGDVINPKVTEAMIIGPHGQAGPENGRQAKAARVPSLAQSPTPARPYARAAEARGGTPTCLRPPSGR